ncbi:hypothetical protein SUGI_0089210 [Cryptomeria japonica]|nr:hypothetical protein SUGI_0089210 [Cryptomeria japonica]
MGYREIKEQEKESKADIEDPHPESGSDNPQIGIREGLEWKRKSLVIIAWSKRAGKYDYSVATANFMMETLKCVFSLVAVTLIWEREGITEDNK